MNPSMSIYATLNHHLGRCLKFLASSQIPLCVYSLWKPIILNCQFLLTQMEQTGFCENARTVFFELVALLEAAKFAPSPCNLRSYIAEVVQLVDRCLHPSPVWDQEAPRVKELLMEPTAFQRMIGVLGSEIFLQSPLHSCLQPEHEILRFLAAFKQYYHTMARSKMIVEGLGHSLSRHDLDLLYDRRANYQSYVERVAPRVKEVLKVDKLPLLALHLESAPVMDEQRDPILHFVPSLTEEQYHEYLSIMEAYLVNLGRDDFRVLGVNAFVDHSWDVTIPEMAWSQGVGPLVNGVAGLLDRHEPFFIRTPPFPIPSVIVDFTAVRDLAVGGDPVLVSACCGQTSVVYLADVGPHSQNSIHGAASGGIMRDPLPPLSRRAQIERNRHRNNFTLGKWVTRWNFNACRGQKRFFVHDTKSFLSARASAVNLRQEVEAKFSASRSEPVIKRFPDTYTEGFWVAINYDEYTCQQALTYFSVDAYGHDFARTLAAKCTQMTKLTFKRPTAPMLLMSSQGVQGGANGSQFLMGSHHPHQSPDEYGIMHGGADAFVGGGGSQQVMYDTAGFYQQQNVYAAEEQKRRKIE
eukprot:GDKK01029962.1.p1 GENE.GDKK01029962.1~~GDKK01029962.1.p1  ORF type:complete len:591 (-),score=103.05 GDKK01029962.1:556-2295(-)